MCYLEARKGSRIQSTMDWLPVDNAGIWVPSLRLYLAEFQSRSTTLISRVKQAIRKLSKL